MSEEGLQQTDGEQIFKDGAVLDIEGKTDPTPAAPTQSEVEIDGQKYIVLPEMAEALEKQSRRDKQERQDLEDRLARQPVQQPTYQEMHAQVTQPQPEKTNVEPIEDRIFSDPAGVLKELKQEITSDLENKYSKAESQRQQADADKQTWKNFYDGFFKENKELSKSKELVETIMQANLGEWQHLTPDRVKERLADKAQGIILGRSRENKSSDSGIVLESGGQPVSGSPVKTEANDNQPKSLSDVIKARRRAKAAKDTVWKNHLGKKK